MKNKKLSHIKSSGFKIPENYLETFDESVLNSLKEMDSFKMVKDSGFKVPDGYFENFDNKLANNIHSEKEVKVISLFSWKKAAYVSGIAASIVLLVGFFNTFESKPSFGNIETAIIENYIVDEDFANEDFASLITEDLTLDKFMDSHLIDSNLEDYILDNASVEDYLNE